MNNNIVFVDSDEIEVTFITLIIRVDAVKRICKSIEKFQRITGNPIGTNGKLIVLKEMCNPAFRLEALMDEKFIPLGLEPKKDYIFLEEQLIKGVGHLVTPYLNKPIPGSENIEWIDSEVRLDGNFVKFRSSETG